MPGLDQRALGEDPELQDRVLRHERAFTGAQGGLSALDVDPFLEPIRTLRIRSRASGPDDGMSYSQYPSWHDIHSSVQSEIDAQRKAGERSLDELRHPPINRGIPYFRAAAGLLKPTRTGSMGESMGAGMEGYAKGLEDENAQELAFHKEAATKGYDIAQKNTAAMDAMYKLGLSKEQIDTTLAMLRERLMTPAEKYAREMGAQPGTAGWKKLVERFEYLKGLTGDQLVEAHSALGSNPDMDTQSLSHLAITQKLQREVLADASKLTFATAADKERYVSEEIARRLATADAQTRSSPNAVLSGAPSGATPPDPSQGPPPQGLQAPPGGPPQGPPPQGLPQAPPPAAPPAAPPAPRALQVSSPPARGAPAAEAPPPDLATRPWAQYLQAPPKNMPPVMNEVEKDEYLQISRANETEGREYKNKFVLPEAAAANEARAAVQTQAAILRKDPTMTGAGKETWNSLKNAMSALGLAPPGWVGDVANAQEFDSFVKKSMLSEQTRQHGVQTEGDAKRILEAIATMGKTPEANHFILRYLDAAAQRAQERSQFFTDYQRANGGRLAGAPDRWQEYLYTNPLVHIVPGAKGKVILFEPEYREYMKEQQKRPPQVT